MRYVGLLRAVNVGGTGKLAMSDLRALVESLGYGAVTTFIASGNVLFDARGAPANVEKKIEAALLSELGLDTDVLVRTAADLAPLAKSHAFAERTTEGSRLHVVFLRDAPDRRAIAKLDVSHSPGDEVLVRGRELHWYAPHGAGQSKLSMAFFERALGVAGTTRNHNTVTKLHALLARA
jgi:uncharacterized protein (DUF1697 family)